MALPVAARDGAPALLVPTASGPESAPLAGPDRANFIRDALASCSASMKKNHPETPPAAANIFCNCMAIKEADATTAADVAYIAAHHEPPPEYMHRLEPLIPSCKAVASAAAGAPPAPAAPQKPPPAGVMMPPAAAPAGGLAGADRQAFVEQYTAGCTGSMQKENPAVSAAVAKKFCGCLAEKGADITSPAEFAELKAHGPTPAQRQRMAQFAPGCRQTATAPPAAAAAGTPLSAEQRATFVRASLDSCALGMQQKKVAAEAAKAYCGCMVPKQADVTTTEDVAYLAAHHEMSADYRHRLEDLVQRAGPACAKGRG